MIDAAHAALMKAGEIPVTPLHVPDMLEQKYVRKNLLEAKYVRMLEDFYVIYKKITHREIKEVRGVDFDRYQKLAKMLSTE